MLHISLVGENVWEAACNQCWQLCSFLLVIPALLSVKHHVSLKDLPGVPRAPWFYPRGFSLPLCWLLPGVASCCLRLRWQCSLLPGRALGLCDLKSVCRSVLVISPSVLWALDKSRVSKLLPIIFSSDTLSQSKNSLCQLSPSDRNVGNHFITSFCPFNPFAPPVTES